MLGCGARDHGDHAAGGLKQVGPFGRAMAQRGSTLTEAAVLLIVGIAGAGASKSTGAETGASSPADMGKVMGVATKKLAGRTDGKAISAAVKALLAKP